jgi:hypothetical protein
MSEEITNYFQTAWEAMHAAAGSLIVEKSSGRQSYFSGQWFFYPGR